MAAADSVGSGTWLDMKNVTLPCVRAGLEGVTNYKYVFSRWVPRRILGRAPSPPHSRAPNRGEGKYAALPKTRPPGGSSSGEPIRVTSRPAITPPWFGAIGRCVMGPRLTLLMIRAHWPQPLINCRSRQRRIGYVVRHGIQEGRYLSLNITQAANNNTIPAFRAAMTG